jgi:hypothetical protein
MSQHVTTRALLRRRHWPPNPTLGCAEFVYNGPLARLPESESPGGAEGMLLT